MSNGDLDKLGQLISDPQGRKTFDNDPGAAMAAAGIDASNVPDAVLATLHDLSAQELRVLARTKQSLKQAGLSDVDIMRIF